MKITEEQEVAERYGLKGPMDRIRQKPKGERAYTNDEIARFESLRAELRAFDDPAQIDRMERAVAVLRGVAQSALQAAWRCPHDMGFDNDLGPLGCGLVAKNLECVCENAPLYVAPVTEGERAASSVVETLALDACRLLVSWEDRTTEDSLVATHNSAVTRARAALTAARDTEGKATPFEIRRNDDGSIDEVVGDVRFVHIEQMNADSWFVAFDTPDGAQQRFWMGSKNRKSEVVFRHDETIPAPVSSTQRG